MTTTAINLSGDIHSKEIKRMAISAWQSVDTPAKKTLECYQVGSEIPSNKSYTPIHMDAVLVEPSCKYTMDFNAGITRINRTSRRTRPKRSIRSLRGRLRPRGVFNSLCICVWKTIVYILTCICVYHTIPYHTIPYHTIPYIHCIALHCIAFHCIAFHSITLHYITLHYIHTYLHVFIAIIIHICIYIYT